MRTCSIIKTYSIIDDSAHDVVRTSDINPGDLVYAVNNSNCIVGFVTLTNDRLLTLQTTINEHGPQKFGNLKDLIDYYCHYKFKVTKFTY